MTRKRNVVVGGDVRQPFVEIELINATRVRSNKRVSCHGTPAAADLVQLHLNTIPHYYYALLHHYYYS